MYYNTKNVLDIAHSLSVEQSTMLEFQDPETMVRASSRITCSSRYTKPFRSRRYATNQIIGVGQGKTIHYILRVERVA